MRLAVPSDKSGEACSTRLVSRPAAMCAWASQPGRETAGDPLDRIPVVMTTRPGGRVLHPLIWPGSARHVQGESLKACRPVSRRL